MRNHVSRRAFRARRREPRQSVDRVDRYTAEPADSLRTKDYPPPIPLLERQRKPEWLWPAKHGLGRQNSELANGPPKNRTGSRRLAAGCRRGPGNVSTKFKLATQRATKRSSFGSLRLRHICEPSRFGDAHDRGPCVRVFPHELLKIRPAQHQKLAICNRNHVSLPD